MLGLRKAMVTVAAAFKAIVSEKKSMKRPKIKLRAMKSSRFCFIGYQYKNKM
jgi:hypothetical protein